MRDLTKVPEGLPVPQDDGAASHLEGICPPDLVLPATDGTFVNLSEIANEKVVLFFYPRTGQPSKPAPADWDLIPGARGCTPQSCSFRDRYADFQELGYRVFGLSTQDSDYQKEFVDRNHIPFPILSDDQFNLTNSLQLPTFHYGGMKLIKRMAWIIESGKIRKVFYPVFPPDRNAEVVIEWIKNNQ